MDCASLDLTSQMKGCWHKLIKHVPVFGEVFACPCSRWHSWWLQERGPQQRAQGNFGQNLGWREVRTKQLCCWCLLSCWSLELRETENLDGVRLGQSSCFAVCWISAERESKGGAGRGRPKQKCCKKQPTTAVPKEKWPTTLQKRQPMTQILKEKDQTTLAKNSQQHYYCEIMTLDTSVAKKQWPAVCCIKVNFHFNLW